MAPVLVAATLGVAGAILTESALRFLGIGVQPPPPSWGNMTQGRTTMSETWTGGGSGNHAGLGGGVISWLFKTLAGINPDPEKPGFERILIKPYIPGDMNYVKASLRTIKGVVESSWKKNDGKITLKVSIPVNTTARVCLPAVDPSSIKEGDDKAESSPGVHYHGKEKDKYIYEIESGHYVFVFDDI
jgi:alpha-L-rhamnosidase